MSSSKHLKMPSYDFPEEMLSEILKRLPVKYVLRCRAVKKSWYYLIKTPIFITLHLNHHKIITTHNSNHPKYLFFCNVDIHVYAIRSDDEKCQEYCTFDYPHHLPNHAWSALSNGLMCLSSMFNDNSHYNPDIYLWNPLVEKHKILPDSPLPRLTSEETMWKVLAFGFLPEVNDYVVVHIVKPLSSCEPDVDLYSVIIGVYSLNTNTWKKISQDNVIIENISNNVAVFVKGVAYWVGDYMEWEEDRQVVMCFDTKTDILLEIWIPDWIEPQLENPLIHPFGESIAYFVEDDESHHLDMWVLKDRQIDEFYWVNKMSVDLSENVWAEVLGIRNNGEPILAKSNNLISYNLDNHEPYDFVDSCDRLTPYSYYKEGSKPPFVIIPFVETLVLLDSD